MIKKETDVKRLLVYVIIAFSMIFNCSPYVTAENQSDSDHIIVSMGDSYSSGEGIDNFYDYDLPIAEKVKSEDWLAHRSQNSWGGQLTLKGVDGVMKEHRDDNWYFVAASGAETKDITGKQEITYNKEDGKYSDTVWLPAQISVFDELKKANKKADYVTLTLGGNDLGFSKIIETAVYIHPFVNKGALADELDYAWKKFYGKTRDDLRTSYGLISNAAGEQATIIVAGYPKLVAVGSVVPLFGFDSKDVKMINDSVIQFDRELENLVTSCRASGMKICFVPVAEGENSFEGHEAYTDVPYINEVSLKKKEQDINDDGSASASASAYSIHPNADGAKVYSALVQAKIDELETSGLETATRTTSDERDIVLVLDTSGSMSGDPIDETKKAATNFISTVLQEDASIGIVTYDSSASMLSDFSVNEEGLKLNAENISSGGSTNIEAGLAKAEEMLSTSSAKKKIIVLMSDGLPNGGKQGDELISYADSIKSSETYIYTLGFFESVSDKKSSAQELMEKIANDGCHYEVTDADDLKFFFGDIADQINGQKYIYVRIACPVDVKVSYGGETLSSVGAETSKRTDFGTLTFEESTETSDGENDDRTKILRLKEGADYDVEISGNGSGKMNYSIGFMDEDGAYSDVRRFNGIEISSKTKIDTVANAEPSTVLKVDSDGDGKYDLRYKAEKNGTGEVVDYSYILYVACGGAFLIALLIIYIKIRQWDKRRNEKKIRERAAKKVYCTNCGFATTGDKKFCPKCGAKIE